jgi:ssDNA-binding Zn-finger/Zn-ribbon topoisomerase 1
MTKISLPPGCAGFDCKDGTKYTADRPGGTVNVAERHADAVKKGQFAGDAHLIGNVGRLSFGTQRGQKCPECRRVWNAWNLACPKCGVDTVEWLG